MTELTMFKDQRSSWIALGIGIVVGINIGSFFNFLHREHDFRIGKPLGVTHPTGQVTKTADCPIPTNSTSTELLSSTYDGIIDNPGLEQNDPRLLSYIREFYLIEMSARPYALSLANVSKSNMSNPSQFASEILQIFNKKKNGGFFIEAGANDGEYLSNTLQLEREYNWTGLLIEPNPFMLTKLLLTNRKAWVASACLSLEGYPQKVRFMHRFRPPNDNNTAQYNDGMGIIEHPVKNPAPPQTKRNPNDHIYAGPVDCFPLYPMLLALNQTVVDYFSLDIEGVELRVLKSIPFHLLTIKVFSIESNLIPEGSTVLKDFMKSKGYRFIFDKLGVESFFVHQDFVDEFTIPLENNFAN